MNNNRNNNNNNNRRRGRGNNRSGGSPSQSNRIDSRARGNAPQMLDKYKKLAQEAQLNDDRVQTEYYLQFADHYFRVMADMKAVKDDQRPARNGERDSDGSDYDDEDGDDSYSRQEERNSDRDEYRRNARPQRDENRREDNGRSGEPQPVEGREGERGDQRDVDNPFTRDAPRKIQRQPRDDRPRDDRPRDDRPRDDRPRDDSPRDDRPRDDKSAAERPAARKPRKPARAEAADTPELGLDPDMLPPSIARSIAAESGNDDGAEAQSAAKPRRQLRPRRPRPSDGEETLEAVG